MTDTKHRFESILHLLLGTTLILKGFDKFNSHPLIGGIMLLCGAIVIGYFVYMIATKKHSTAMHILIHIFEAMVSLFIAYIFFKEGKQYVQYGFIVAAIGFLIAAYMAIRNRSHKHAS